LRIQAIKGLVLPNLPIQFSEASFYQPEYPKIAQAFFKRNNTLQNLDVKSLIDGT
jgi:hypothetical protein